MNYQMNKIHISGNIEVQTPTIPFVMNCPCFRTLPIHGNLLIWKRYSISQRSILPNMMMNHHFLRRLVFILLTIFWRLENLRYLDSSVPILITLPSKKTRIENSSQTGYEFIDKEYIRNQDDVNLRKLGKFYLQLQNKNIPYSKEKPAPTNFVPKLLSLIKMMKKTTVSERFTIFLSILVGSKSFWCLRQYFDPLSRRFKGFGPCTFGHVNFWACNEICVDNF